MFSLETWILYSITVVIFVVYLLRKYSVRKYIVSAYNIEMFNYAFDLLFMPFIFTHSRAWQGWYSLDYAQEPFNKCLQINLFGFIIVLLSLSYFEFRQRHADRLISQIKKMSGHLNDIILQIAWWMVVVLWYAIVFKFNGGLPLFNRGRSFYYRQSISPVYQALNALLICYALYFGLRFIYHRKKLFFCLITVLTLLFTGTRTPVLISVLGPLVLFKIYCVPRENKNKKSVRSERQPSRNVFPGFSRMIWLAFILSALLAGGLAMGAIRAGRSTSLTQMIQELLYGNTFSDIRDGTIILIRFNRRFHDTLLMGKTYMSALISFIPNSLSAFRSQWSWGRLTAYTLLGFENHFGMRGGNSMEPFLNFGMGGVFILSIIDGYYQAARERIFYEHFMLCPSDVSGKEPFVICFLPGILSFFAKSGSLSAIYAQILFFLVVSFYSMLMQKKY